MKTAIALTIAAVTAAAQAQPATTSVDVTTTLKTWQKPDFHAPAEHSMPKLKLGKSDYVVSGPLIDAFRFRKRPETDRTLGQKIADLPIINILIPEPMPRPPREGTYFRWGQKEDLAWTTQMERRGSGPRGVLLTVGK